MPTRAGAYDLEASDAAKAGPGGERAWIDHNLHMNDIMTVGTHNSYKQAISEPILAMIRNVAPQSWEGLDYHHAPLDQQLDDGARALELDLIHDPEGGRYAYPAGMKLTGQPIPDDYVAAMSEPGLKVMHIQDLDFRSSCPTFIGCLKIIRAWSLAHPDHVPILITMNTSDGKSRAPGGVDGLPFDETAYDGLDREVRSVFPESQLITPDQIQGDYPTLREAVLERGWPKLGATRGKFLFALDEQGRRQAAYRGARKSLEGRALFVNSEEGSPVEAYLTLNDHADAPRITAAVKAGFLVRTRADAETVEARRNDGARRDAAFKSGAQYVSTDYMRPDSRFSTYQARLPDGVIAVANHQRSPERCAGLSIEP